MISECFVANLYDQGCASKMLGSTRHDESRADMVKCQCIGRVLCDTMFMCIINETAIIAQHTALEKHVFAMLWLHN